MNSFTNLFILYVIYWKYTRSVKRNRKSEYNGGSVVEYMNEQKENIMKKKSFILTR